MERHVLIVEDEQDISDLIKVQLESFQYKVTVLGNGTEALDYIQNNTQNDQSPDLYILDRMLPGTSGLEICKFIRMYKPTKNAPILMVTAMTRPDQIIEGLDAGADDYITKPFDIYVLAARVRSLLRRTEFLEKRPEDDSSNIFKVGELKVDTHQCKAFSGEEELELTLSEYKLLSAFLKDPGKVLTRNQLVEFIQDGPVHVTDRTIDTHVFGLRKKLKEHSTLIETIRGIGYRVSPSD